MCRARKILQVAERVIASSEAGSSFDVAAVVTQGSKIISTGRNTWRVDPFINRNYASYCTAHAEVEALRAARRTKASLVDAVIYVFRWHKDGTLAVARPCEACRKALAAHGIVWACYSTHADYCCQGLTTRDMVRMLCWEKL